MTTGSHALRRNSVWLFALALCIPTKSVETRKVRPHQHNDGLPPVDKEKLYKNPKHMTKLVGHYKQQCWHTIFFYIKEHLLLYKIPRKCKPSTWPRYNHRHSIAFLLPSLPFLTATFRLTPYARYLDVVRLTFAEQPCFLPTIAFIFLSH